MTSPRFYSGDPGGNQTGINDLQIIDIPVEFGWTAWHNVPFRVFGDYAINLDGNERAADAGHPGAGQSEQGLAGGSRHRQGPEEGRLGSYLATGSAASKLYALDPNLIDNDIFDAHLNMQGVVRPRRVTPSRMP